MAKPILRWAGSKRKLLGRLSVFWRPAYNRYVEPFAGSACLFFYLQPPKAVLGDINEALIEAYEVVREDPDGLHAVLSAMPVNRSYYYRLRKCDPAKMKLVDRAARFVYLNRLCFNGLYRTNRSGQFNVPYGGNRGSSVPTVEAFRQCAILLKRACLRAADFGHTLSDTQKGDFVYLDPPYQVSSRRIFKEYGSKHFNTCDLDRLVGHLDRMHLRGVKFVVSYADCPEGRMALKDWHLVRVRTRRNIAGASKYRRHAYELLASNVGAVVAGKESPRD